MRHLPLVAALCLVTACPDRTTPKADAGPAARKPVVDAGVTYDQLLRIDFNQRAQELFLPLFWRQDTNKDKVLSPDELAVLWGPQNARREDYVVDGRFTKAFNDAYAAMGQLLPRTPPDPAQRKRDDTLKLELSQGRPTLVETDLSKGSAEDRAVADHLLKGAVLLEKLYANQRGTTQLAAKLSASDTLGRAVFHRNQGPWCEAPRTEKDEDCFALPGKATKRVFGLYPAELQADPKFCEQLEKNPAGKKLAEDHFAVVVKDGDALKSVPYTEVWKDDMEAVAKELDLAATALTSAEEAAFKAYLTAAAQGFRSNDWEPANAAWVAMSSTNSKWYARVGPDEVYFEPCAWKAGFALQLARINRDSLDWQKKLEPVKGDLEKALAALAGPPYKARAVAFKLPDFIDVVVNAGDQRNPHGATIGQSLPNWGPIAQKGGRTVVMTNLYTDPDSQRALKMQMESLFCAATMKKATTEQAPALMSIVLHEASHNLGPIHEYTVKGKKDHELFGGPLSAMMEELKAQTAALYFSDWLVTKKVIDAELAQQAHVRDVAWAFGHISRGMYDASGKPKTYSQLASVQLGWLLKEGALEWKAADKAANDADPGCFELNDAKWSAAVESLAKRVLKAKGQGDRAAADKLKADFVDAEGEWRKLREVIITQRWLFAPKATFVYSVRQ